MKRIFIFLFFFLSIFSNAQNWESFTDSICTFSSPRSSDLNGDGIMDIVIGGGTDSLFSNNGVMAYNGVDGSLLWNRSSRDELFGSAIFQDLNSDGINDVIISGRAAQLLAIDGSNGVLLWDFFPFGTNPSDSGFYNFYNPQFIHDVDGDSYDDILISNGGDHSAPSFQPNRPPGHLMIISAQNGNIIQKAVVPDSSEIYCSPLVADLKNNGDQWVLYGTGGENYGGNFYAVLLSDLLLGDISSSIILDTDLNKGFIAPAAIHQTSSGSYDIIIQSYDGLITKIDGQTFSPIWTYQKSGTESSAEPVIGNFTGDLTPDILLVLFNGFAPAFNDYFQVMLDGQDGSVQFIDSLGDINFASANAVDLNNDGRDEGIFSITYFDNGYFTNKVQSIDFNNDTIILLDQVRTGVNIASTPLITDLDNNGFLDLVYSVKEDSLNPMGLNGINIYRHELNSIIPNSGIAWGSYLGTNMDGAYNSDLTPCWFGTIISSFNRIFPFCNGSSDGSISLNLVGTLPYTYLWSNQSTDSSINNLNAGTYWVQVTDSTGCYELISINLPDPYALMFGEIIPPCLGDTNGTATVVSSGCPCMFTLCTFLWDNGVTSSTNLSLSSGWHSVAITHASGCVVVDSVFIPFPYNGGMSSHTACDSYDWDGVTYDSTGIYINVYTDVNGCDSTETLDLTINNSSSSTASATACYSYDWNGMTYDSIGIYTWVGVNGAGCDSTVTLDLTINNSSSSLESAMACDSYNWDGMTYDSTGIYINLYTDVNGCDSTVTLDLIINYSSSSIVTVSVCDTSFLWDGMTYDSTGMYTNVYTALNGCDSTVSLDLTINNSLSSTVTVTACDSFNWDGMTYDSTGMYTNLYTDVNGCDSAVTLDLTINNSSLSTVIVSSCDSYDWDGMTYDSTGMYTNIYSNSQGCDSTHTLNLTINTSDTTMISVISCESYLWNGAIFDSSGVYNFTFSNSLGCDSLVYLNLAVINNVVEIVSTNNNLTVNLISGSSPFSYVWNTGENTGQITPNTNGQYWVIVTDNSGCVSDTVFYNVTWVPSSLSNLNIHRLNVYPNPSNDNFYIEFESIVNQNIIVKIINIVGAEVYREDRKEFIGEYTKQISLGNYGKGIYFLEIETNTGIINKKLILQ